MTEPLDISSFIKRRKAFRVVMDELESQVDWVKTQLEGSHAFDFAHPSEKMKYRITKGGLSLNGWTIGCEFIALPPAPPAPPPPTEESLDARFVMQEQVLPELLEQTQWIRKLFDRLFERECAKLNDRIKFGHSFAFAQPVALYRFRHLTTGWIWVEESIEDPVWPAWKYGKRVVYVYVPKPKPHAQK